MSGEGWTDERIEILTTMWKGGSSAGEIGKTLRCTRNAALGKLHRLGLTKTRSKDVARFNIKRLTPKGRTGTQQPRVAKPPRLNVHPGNIVRSFAARAHDPGLKASPKVDRTFPHAKPWTERTFGQCAFPVGERGEIQSCCAPTERTYCKACEAVMFKPEQPSMRKTMRISRLAA